MMRVGNFSVTIPEGKEGVSGHVELPHGATYTIRLMNHWHVRRCDAQISVDGKDVGTFRVNKSGWIELERPVNDTGKFTFFKSDSDEAQAAGVSSITKDNRGLIQVVVKPEKYVPPVTPVYQSNHMRGGPCGQSVTRGAASPPQMMASCGEMQFTSASCEGLEKTAAGVTGLTGQSNQSFYEVPNLDYDPAEEITISLRLVCGQTVRPLEPIQKGNPVPAAVE